MNPDVITTGPGVIIATATASTNWRSVSQWWPCTTPPYRKGMMANPLPKTKAPAAAKNVKMAHKVPPVVAATANRAARGTGDRLATPVFPFPRDFQSELGGALTSQTRKPAARKSSTCSD